jgi:hypothetical protein
MKQDEQHQINQSAINRIKQIPRHGYWITPRYKTVIDMLLAEGYETSRGNIWTTRRLYRMLQREGFCGLRGLFSSEENWQFVPYVLKEKGH